MKAFYDYCLNEYPNKLSLTLDEALRAGYEPSLNDYPIFEESYRSILNEFIIEHYRYYELGFETIDLFDHYLKRRMAEIMSVNNELYKSLVLVTDPLKNYLKTKTTSNTSNIDSTTNSQVDNTRNDLNINSDTPQDEILVGDIQNNLYASEANVNETTDNQTASTNNLAESTFSASETEDGILNISQSELLMKYRETFIDVDTKVINELRDLFSLIY